MWEFLRKIFSEQDTEVTVVVIDEHDPNGSSSFKLGAKDIIKQTLLVIFISVLITTIIFFATPLGSFYQHQQNESLRQQVLSISDRVQSLQDSLVARDNQLSVMQSVLREGSDTSFALMQQNLPDQQRENRPVQQSVSDVNAYEMLSQNEIIFSGRLDGAPDFPANYPLQGTFTQGYSVDQGHFGIDIAARPGTEFRSLADGTVLNASWTINFGYVIYVQHADGIMSIYKHGSKLLKEQGDFVLKGDILGTIADRGVMSSGSHLHLEIWKNGVPQDPIMYLIN